MSATDLKNVKQLLQILYINSYLIQKQKLLLLEKSRTQKYIKESQ